MNRQDRKPRHEFRDLLREFQDDAGSAIIAMLARTLDDIGVCAANADFDDHESVTDALEWILNTVVALAAPEDGCHPGDCRCQFCREDIEAALAAEDDPDDDGDGGDLDGGEEL